MRHNLIKFLDLKYKSRWPSRQKVEVIGRGETHIYSYVANRTKLLQCILKIWQHLLKLKIQVILTPQVYF